MYLTLYLTIAIFAFEADCSYHQQWNQHSDQGLQNSHGIDSHVVNFQGSAGHVGYQSNLESHGEYNAQAEYHHTGAADNFGEYQGPIAVPFVLSSGHIADTEDVAEAKSHHLSAVAEAKSNKFYGGHQEHGYGGAYGYSSSQKGYGIPVVLPNGHIADTEDVAAAKSSHLLAVAKIQTEGHYHGPEQGFGHSGSHDGYGIPVVLPSGYIADTEEVAAAKSAHMAVMDYVKNEEAYHHHQEMEGYKNEHEYQTLQHQVPHYPSHTVHHQAHH